MHKKTEKTSALIHVSFEIGLLVKGIDGLLEIIGGIILIFLSPDRLNRFIHLATQHELSQDPKDIIANTLITWSQSFSISTQQFATFYLMSHGIIKCIIIFLLWHKKLWAYPFSILSLVFFIGYQIYRYTISQSVFLIMLSLFDMIMIALTYIEYKNLKAKALPN